MTKKEAVRIAQGLSNGFKCESETMVEFCNVVIQALEQQPYNDCISRQMVLEYIEGSEAELGHDSENESVRQDIKELPSVAQEPCEDCVSRQVVRDTIYVECSGEKLDIDFAKVLLLQRAIKDLPPVTPQLKTGRWEFVHPLQEDDGGAYMCSECRAGYLENPGDWNYCPNCGAKMQEAKE